MASIVFDNGHKVELSQETTDRLKKELCNPKGFERVYDDGRLRLSSVMPHPGDKKHRYPIRLSILEQFLDLSSCLGSPIGDWDNPDHVSCGIPGIILTIEDAEQLSIDLQKCINFVKG